MNIGIRIIRTIVSRWWVLLITAFVLTTIGSLGVVGGFIIDRYFGASILVNTLILAVIFLSVFLPINGFFYIILPSFRGVLRRSALKNSAIIAAGCLGIIAGTMLCWVVEDIIVKYTNKQAEPIIQAIDNYYETHDNVYPDTLEELGIQNPTTIFGSNFGYMARNYTDKKSNAFYLSFTRDWNSWYEYSSYRRKWELKYWK